MLLVRVGVKEENGDCRIVGDDQDRRAPNHTFTRRPTSSSNQPVLAVVPMSRHDAIVSPQPRPRVTKKENATHQHPQHSQELSRRRGSSIPKPYPSGHIHIYQTSIPFNTTERERDRGQEKDHMSRDIRTRGKPNGSVYRPAGVAKLGDGCGEGRKARSNPPTTSPIHHHMMEAHPTWVRGQARTSTVCLHHPSPYPTRKDPTSQQEKHTVRQGRGATSAARWDMLDGGGKAGHRALGGGGAARGRSGQPFTISEKEGRKGGRLMGGS